MKTRNPFLIEHQEIYRYMVEMGICVRCRIRWATNTLRCDRCKKMQLQYARRKKAQAMDAKA